MIQITNKKGFTLLEVLIGVAILVILLGLSIPSVISASANLDITKLDAAAKEIYTAAQNRLTALKASGQLEKFTSDLEPMFTSRNLDEKFSTAPSGYPEGDDSWKSLYYLSSDDAVFQNNIMSQTAYQAIEGKYIVELNPETGDVFSVFYGEYDNAGDLIDTYESYTYSLRGREDRQAVKIGYYSGSDLSVAILPNAFQPTIMVHNNEELYLEITCKDMLQFAATRQYLTVTLTLTDEHGGKWERQYNGLDDLEVAGSDVRLYVLLDSMQSGEDVFRYHRACSRRRYHSYRKNGVFVSREKR